MLDGECFIGLEDQEEQDRTHHHFRRRDRSRPGL
jgi:hypothetical protein